MERNKCHKRVAWGYESRFLGDRVSSHRFHGGDENQWRFKEDEMEGTVSLEALDFACSACPQGDKGGAFLIKTRPLPARGCHCCLFSGNRNGMQALKTQKNV